MQIFNRAKLHILFIITNRFLFFVLQQKNYICKNLQKMAEQEKIKLEVLGISSQNKSDAFTLILAIENSMQRLPIVIGLPEAQSIAVQLENIKTPRPLTHDLFTSFAISFDIFISEVILYDFRDGIFYSKIVCHQESKIVELDARTSDAVAIALRFNCPIYTFKHIIDEVLFDNDNIRFRAKQNKSIENLPNEELVKLLEAAINSENYEQASKIRDILNSRNNI